MKLYCYILFVLLCLTNAARSQLAFQTDVFEFHPDIKTTSINADFPFINIGSNPITIKEIKPSCGCTVATISKMTYAPGEKGVIKATYTIHGSIGIQAKEIAVTTVEDPTSIKMLTIKAYIPELVEASPQRVSWDIGAPLDTKNIKLVVTYDKPVKVLGIEWTTDRVIAKLITTTKDKLYQISIIPLSTSDPVEGAVVMKLQIPDTTVPKLFFIPFRITAKAY